MSDTIDTKCLQFVSNTEKPAAIDILVHIDILVLNIPIHPEFQRADSQSSPSAHCKEDGKGGHRAIIKQSVKMVLVDAGQKFSRLRLLDTICMREQNAFRRTAACFFQIVSLRKSLHMHLCETSRFCC